MLTIVKQNQQGDRVEVSLAGAIDETTDLQKLLGIRMKELHVTCREIDRINSTGVKSWVRYFSNLATHGVRLRFSECSPAIVEQINMISNFICGAKIESVVVPYLCSNPSCQAHDLPIMTVGEIRELDLQIPDRVCARCQGTTCFDDIPEDYFSFLTKNAG